MRAKRWAVLISGRGSNLCAALEMRGLVDIVCVVSSKAHAPGLARARRAGVPTHVLPPRLKSEDWQHLTKRLRSLGVERLLLAGFMRILPAAFVEDWTERIVNIHPSLLPAYPGLESIERAYADGAEIGVTLHRVTAEVDRGKIIARRKVVGKRGHARYSLNTSEFLVHVSEHRLVREVLWKTNLIWS